MNDGHSLLAKRVILAVFLLVILGVVAYASLSTNKAPLSSPPPSSPPPETKLGAGMNIPPEITPPSVDSHAYIKGQVVSIDLTEKKLMYKLYMFTTVGTTVESVIFQENIAVYRVDSEAKVTTTSARTAIVPKDIKSGQTIFIQVDINTPPGKTITPLEFIVLGE